MLFRYRLELAKANGLGRAIQFLKQFEKNYALEFDLEHVELSYNRIKNDVADDYELIRDTLDMAFLSLASFLIL
jgi:hypothetical protein